MISLIKRYLEAYTIGLIQVPILGKYLSWLQGDSFDKPVEKYPVLNNQFETTLKNCFIVGDLTGIPLLKQAANSGTELVTKLVKNGLIETHTNQTELVIVGAGISGISAALQAQSLGINFILIESNRAYSTIANFPANKPIFLEPNFQKVHGHLKLEGATKEKLLNNLDQQFNSAKLNIVYSNVSHLSRENNLIQVHCSDAVIKSKVVILAIGKSGNSRRLNVPGESLSKVVNRIFDPMDFKDQNLLVVGGGNSAVEAAIACAENGSRVTLSYRGSRLCKPSTNNLAKLESFIETGKIDAIYSSNVKEIRNKEVEFDNGRVIQNDAVLVQIGKELPYDFFRKSKIQIEGTWNKKTYRNLLICLICVTMFFLWKKALIFTSFYSFAPSWKPNWLSIDAPFIYGALYSLAVTCFGIKRIQRRPTSYITLQTIVLILIQIFPLWILPTMLIPWMGHENLLPGWFKTQVMMVSQDTYLTGENCWRAYGFILAWPLFPFMWIDKNVSVFWIVYGILQSFIVIPWLVYRFGKGAYCGWICSCGALAETVGDQLRTKTPHGPFWKKAENWGQIFLLAITTLTLINFINILSNGLLSSIEPLYVWLKALYIFVVDFVFASVLGIGMYLFLGGRFWCRLFCPLAALMHVYAKFSRFRIFSEKERCISCNVCSKVCHQGIDVMSYASRGIPMNDVQCVQCSACVVDCPTNVLKFDKL